MNKIVSKLTVFFEDPFWVGVCEQNCEEGYKACKITFGSEPKDYEVYDFMLKNWLKMRFSPITDIADDVEAGLNTVRPANPKRMQREAKKQTRPVGVGTKAQQALKLQHEQVKTERKTESKEQLKAEKERIRALKAQKHKEKHRGH